MQKISIKNFGPIKNIDNLEIPKVLIIIGQQASGKSTISKLIYFFKSLRNDIIQNLEDHAVLEIEQTQQNFIRSVKIKFNLYFGLTKDENFEITYFYSNNKFIQIVPSHDNSIDINASWYFTDFYKLILDWDNFLQLKEKHNNLFFSKETNESATDLIIKKRNEKTLKDAQIEIDKQINNLVDSDFDDYHRLYFIPAGRSLLSSFKQSHQSKFVSEFNEARKSYFEFFVRDFFERINNIKTDILFGKTINEVIKEAEFLDNKKHEDAKIFKDLMFKILKAEYKIDATGEKLYSENFAIPVKLDFASSGQQEVIWILLQLIILILEAKPSFVVIEEPEAHLYPIAQTELLNAIALFVNSNINNQIIITTHSPYILTAINNLLFAQRVANKYINEKNMEISKIIPQKFWLNPSNFEAIYLTENGSKNIFNTETGVISESELDDASEIIMESFDDLMQIYKS